ncbi:glycosyltransferase [bacterium]|jgi:glycosyltransferase involved in cell wall biosynthesis|nr:glycosyltransferase [bacterium]
MSLKVSVIMNCYNSDKYLREAIESIYSQTYTNWEIIFIDNQSTDNSPKIAKSYSDKLKYYLTGEYLKLGAGRNMALEKVSGDLIAFLDCDDRWLPNNLEIQVKTFMDNPKVGFSYSNYFYFDQNNQSQRLIFKNKAPSGDIFSLALNDYQCGILTVIFRKSLLRHLSHYFDTSLNLAEDYDFFMRILYYCEAKYIHEPLSIYRFHNENLTNTFKESFPDEVIYSLNKFKRMNLDRKNIDLVDRRINMFILRKSSIINLSRFRFREFLCDFINLKNRRPYILCFKYVAKAIVAYIKNVI